MRLACAERFGARSIRKAMTPATRINDKAMKMNRPGPVASSIGGTTAVWAGVAAGPVGGVAAPGSVGRAGMDSGDGAVGLFGGGGAGFAGWLAALDGVEGGAGAVTARGAFGGGVVVSA